MSDQVFNLELLKRANQEPSFWQKIRLWFKPINYSYDDGCTIWFQEIDGTIFIRKLIYQENNSN